MIFTAQFFVCLQFANQLVPEGELDSAGGKLVDVCLSAETELFDFGVEIGAIDWTILVQEVQLLFWRIFCIVHNAQIQLQPGLNLKNLLTVIVALKVFVLIASI